MTTRDRKQCVAVSSNASLQDNQHGPTVSRTARISAVFAGLARKNLARLAGGLGSLGPILAGDSSAHGELVE